MTLLLVEIDVVVRIVEEALVLLDEIAAETDRKTFGKRNIDRALRLEAVILEAVARTRPACEIAFGLGRNDIDRADDRVAAIQFAMCSPHHLDSDDTAKIEGGEV